MKWGQLKSQLSHWFKALIKDEYLYLRFFALFLAIVLWFLAGGIIRFASVEKTFTIPVHVRNIPRDFALIDEPEPVKISVRSLSPLTSVAERDTQAFVDLSDVVEGIGTYVVDVSVPAGVEIVNVSPRWLRLNTERILEKDFPIFIAALGLKPGQLIHTYLPHTSEIRARGPRSKLSQVSQVVAYVGLIHGANRLEGTFPIKALDEAGRIIEGINFYPEDIRVILETVTMKPQSSGEELLLKEEMKEENDQLLEGMDQEQPVELEEEVTEESEVEQEELEQEELEQGEEEDEDLTGPEDVTEQPLPDNHQKNQEPILEEG